MVNVMREPETFSPAPRSENILEYVLNEDSTLETLRSGLTNTAQVGQGPALPLTTGRTKSRVLFISTDVNLLAPQTELLEKLASLNAVFEEIHIAVIECAGKPRFLTDKIADRVFVYGATASHWWQMLTVAEELMKKQLEFTDGFRPDIIVALDPFEAGYIGLKLSEKYQRPFQVHLLEDIFSESFLYSRPHAKMLLRLSRHVLKQTESICVTSQSIKEKVKKNFAHLKEPLLLPRYYNIKAILSETREQTVKPAKLARFKFIALFVGTLNHDSTLFRAIDASRTILRSPAIALVVIGDGPMKKEFQNRANIFGINEQLIFEPASVDVISYMRSANLLVCTDVTPESEEIVIKAAAVGLPILAARTDLRNDVFTDEENAFLCDKDDTIEFSQKLSKFLNNNGTRVQFAHNARTTIKDRLHEDPEVFKVAYRDAIESALSLAPLKAS